MKLIRYAVLCDTANFSKEAKKATQDDVDVMSRIDLLLGLCNASRKVDYMMVMQAKTDLSRLSVYQCLKKDLKVSTQSTIHRRDMEN